MRRLLPALGLFTALLISSNAHAQFSQYGLPIDRGVLQSKVEVQAQYSSLEDLDALFFSLAGAYNFGSFEVGLNVPFLQGWQGDQDWQLGDIRLDAKYKVLGLGKTFGLAVFGHFYVPTHSGDSTHAYFRLQAGAAVSAQLLGFEVGGGLQTIGNIVGDNRPDLWLLGAYGFARVPILGIIAIQAALEYFNSFHPSGDLNALFITPGIEASFIGFHVGIGSRIAITNDAKLFGQGRASLLINAGFSW